MIVKEVVAFSTEIAESLRRLFPQLSAGAAEPSDAEINRIIQSEASHLIVARDEQRGLGFLTLVVCPIPSGKLAWIEDVSSMKILAARVLEKN